MPEDNLLHIPIAHGEGNYFCDARTLEDIEANDQILFQYSNADGELTDDANPNGSLRNIAGICNAAGNVAGMMPHPERASEDVLGSDDGRLVFESLFHALQSTQPELVSA